MTALALVPFLKNLVEHLSQPQRVLTSNRQARKVADPTPQQAISNVATRDGGGAGAGGGGGRGPTLTN
jgi:hypothetical protein